MFPIADIYLLLEHGAAKSARFFADESHMGGARAIDVIVPWLARHLSA